MPRLSSAFLSHERGKNASAWMSLNGVKFHVAWWWSEGFQKKLVTEDSPATAFDELLLGWENLEDDDGEPLPSESEDRIKLLQDYPEILSSVVGFSKNALNFTAVTDTEGEVGN